RDLIRGELEGDLVADDHVQAAVEGADEHAAGGGVGGIGGQRRQQEGLTAPQALDGFGDGELDVDALGRVGHQRRVDRVEAVTLRPREGRLGLVDRQERRQQEEHEPEQAGDDRDILQPFRGGVPATGGGWGRLTVRHGSFRHRREVYVRPGSLPGSPPRRGRSGRYSTYPTGTP